jgi:hypothetical protein
MRLAGRVAGSARRAFFCGNIVVSKGAKGLFAEAF